MSATAASLRDERSAIESWASKSSPALLTTGRSTLSPASRSRYKRRALRPRLPRPAHATLWSASQNVSHPEHKALCIALAGSPFGYHPTKSPAARAWSLHTLRPQEIDEDYVPRSPRPTSAQSNKTNRSSAPALPSLPGVPNASASSPSSALPKDSSPERRRNTLHGHNLTHKQPQVHRPTSIMRNPFNTMKGSRLAKLIEAGAIGLVKASYFEDCEIRNLPFGKRQDIPFMFMWPGNRAVEMWVKHGKCFMCSVSYTWLSKRHPDPNRYHLKRMVRIFNEYKKLWGMQEVGVILDYCSLWQPDGDRDYRTEEQKEQFRHSLEEINTPYGHKGVTSFTLTGVPSEEPRGYNDRGWTLFENIMIDAKGGDWNRWSFGSFDPNGHWTDAYAFFSEARPPARRVLLTPEDFEEALEQRRQKVQALNLPLFTNAADDKAVPERYREAFWHMTRATKLNYCELGWGDEELRLVTRILPSYCDLEVLELSNNKFTVHGVNQLALVIPRLKNLQLLRISGNPCSNNSVAREALSTVWKKSGKNMRSLEF
mmetsp:Transcript_36218/g.84956  ORF Transcript_36218/g.84956 Transcript_36218/m.84956 type:complete len:542 (+) Transcript_36218:143-1768(+)